MWIRTRWTESGRKNQNYAAEGEIGILSRQWQQQMTRKKGSKETLGLWTCIQKWDTIPNGPRKWS
jgi:hypothetical protein